MTEEIKKKKADIRAGASTVEIYYSPKYLQKWHHNR